MRGASHTPASAWDGLQEAAAVSAPGSMLVASIVSKAFVDDLKQREVYKNPDSIMSGWKWGCPQEPGEVGCGVLPPVQGTTSN